MQENSGMFPALTLGPSNDAPDENIKETNTSHRKITLPSGASAGTSDGIKIFSTSLQGTLA